MKKLNYANVITFLVLLFQLCLGVQKKKELLVNLQTQFPRSEWIHFGPNLYPTTG